MTFIWRRKSKSLVKTVALLIVFSLTINFLVFIDNVENPAQKWNRYRPLWNDLEGVSGHQKEVDRIGLNKISDFVIKESTIQSKSFLDVSVPIEWPGDMGKPVILPANMSAELKKAVDDGWEKCQFNQVASDMMSVHRSLPDYRDPWCKEPGRFKSDLPVTDVVICVYNEAWSVLLRTVHSVLDRSPPHLIGHVILVDDFSDMPHTKKPLEDYFKAYPKVKIVRATKREGLIRARLLGLRHATSPVITFLDSHCECTEGWLEPLLDRIARNPNTVVLPVINGISGKTMEFEDNNGYVSIGGFSWGLHFRWISIPEREMKRRNNSAEPVASVTMLGGLFALDRQFFEKLGTYDPEFEIWGGEEFELSFKIWMCGGTMEIVPCSHVGHIFRGTSPYKKQLEGNVVRRNFERVAEVWMDDYKKYYYLATGDRKGDYGDVTSRKELRKRLGCKSFKWFLDNVYPELYIPDDAYAIGEIKNLGYGGRKCLDAGSDILNPIFLYPCHQMGGNQFWVSNKAGEIRKADMCLEYSGNDVTLYSCHGKKENQLWSYNNETKQILHESKKCLAFNEKQNKVIMAECESNREEQRWLLQNYNSSAL